MSLQPGSAPNAPWRPGWMEVFASRGAWRKPRDVRGRSGRQEDEDVRHDAPVGAAGDAGVAAANPPTAPLSARTPVAWARVVPLPRGRRARPPPRVRAFRGRWGVPDPALAANWVGPNPGGALGSPRGMVRLGGPADPAGESAAHARGRVGLRGRIRRALPGSGALPGEPHAHRPGAVRCDRPCVQRDRLRA